MSSLSPLASFHTDDFPVLDLLDRKLTTGTTVSVVLPARNEEATVAGIVRSLRTHLMDDVPLVDELVVMDSFSNDATAARAVDAGATVVTCSSVLPQIPASPGKGEALWRSLFATTGDVLVFVDADLRDAGPHMVTGLLGPLLVTGHSFSKGAYRRPLLAGDSVSPDGGGRVTELVARPILNLYWPELGQFVQPLGGEYAARREVLEQLSFPTGYGVEIAMLVDLLGRIGIAGMAQVDLGRRTHRHQDVHALGAMAAEVLGTALRRLDLEPTSRTLRQFRHLDGKLHDRNIAIPLTERPPAATQKTAIRPRMPLSGAAKCGIRGRMAVLAVLGRLWVILAARGNPYGMTGRNAYRPRRLIVGAAILGLILALAITALTANLWRGLNPFGSDTVDRSRPALLESVRDLSQYHAAVGDFQVVIDVEQDIKFVPSALAGQRTLFVAAGTVNSYVDFSGLAGDALTVSPDGKSVAVRLPRPALDKPNLDSERSYVFAQKRGVLNKLNDLLNGADQHEFYVRAEQRIAEAAEASKLRDQAETNTRAMLTGMLGSLGYQVTFSTES